LSTVVGKRIIKHSSTIGRGVARIFTRGFLRVVDPRCRGLGVQPPDADKLLLIIRCKVHTVIGLISHMGKSNYKGLDFIKHLFFFKNSALICIVGGMYVVELSKLSHLIVLDSL